MKTEKLGLIIGLVIIIVLVFSLNKDANPKPVVRRDVEKNVTDNFIDRKKTGILVHKYQDNAYGLYYYLVVAKDHMFFYKSEKDLYVLFFDDFVEITNPPFQKDRVIENPSVYISIRNMTYITDTELQQKFELIDRESVDKIYKPSKQEVNE